MVHTYRNRKRTRINRIGDGLFALVWCFGGVVVLAVAEGIFGDSLLMVVAAAPVLVLWMAPLYSHLFRRYYEIRFSDEGACEFRGTVRSKQLRAQQIASIERNSSRTWRSDGDETEHTRFRFQGGGSLIVVQPLEGFDDFLNRLHAQNPFIALTAGKGPSGPTPEPPAADEPANTTPGNRFLRSAFFPLCVIALLVYLAQTALSRYGQMLALPTGPKRLSLERRRRCVRRTRETSPTRRGLAHKHARGLPSADQRVGHARRRSENRLQRARARLGDRLLPKLFVVELTVVPLVLVWLLLSRPHNWDVLVVFIAS